MSAIFNTLHDSLQGIFTSVSLNKPVIFQGENWDKIISLEDFAQLKQLSPCRLHVLTC